MAITINLPLKVLITRPQNEADELVTLLAQRGISAQAEPLFDMVQTTQAEQLAALTLVNNVQLSCAQQAIVIFVSPAAVQFANAYLPIAQWQAECLIAVGEKTKALLQQFAPNHRAIVAPLEQNSEGVLALAALQQVAQRDVIIVRGDSGRELLAETLHKRGARVHYVACYSRVWRAFEPIKTAQQWQNQQFNCIVATSNGLLERMVEILSPMTDYWSEQCLWLVASQRIAEHAKSLALTQVINMASANNQTICNTIADYGKR